MSEICPKNGEPCGRTDCPGFELGVCRTTPPRAGETVTRYLAPVGTYLELPEENDAVDVRRPMRLVLASAYDTLAQRVRELEGALHVAEGMKNSAIEAGAASLRATAEVLGLPDAPMKLEDLAALRMSELTAATQQAATVRTDSFCDDVIDRLDDIARDHDAYDYGLPIMSKQEEMRSAILAAVAAATISSARSSAEESR